jgi:hypothetical protein
MNEGSPIDPEFPVELDISLTHCTSHRSLLFPSLPPLSVPKHLPTYEGYAYRGNTLQDIIASAATAFGIPISEIVRIETKEYPTIPYALDRDGTKTLAAVSEEIRSSTPGYIPSLTTPNSTFQEKRAHLFSQLDIFGFVIMTRDGALNPVKMGLKSTVRQVMRLENGVKWLEANLEKVGYQKKMECHLELDILRRRFLDGLRVVWAPVLREWLKDDGTIYTTDISLQSSLPWC